MSSEKPLKNQEKVSKTLRDFVNGHVERDVTIGEMVHYFGDRAFGFLLMVFALICIIPLPIPGIHMFLAIPLFYLSIQQMIGRHQIWFPDKVNNYVIPKRALHDVGLKTVPWIERIEAISKQRLSFMARGVPFQIFGAIAFYITAFLSIPLPLTNLVPAIGIVFMAIGLLVRDGVFLIIGSVIGVVWSLAWFTMGVAGLILVYKQLTAIL